jgi:hypothetical protein
MKQRAPANKNNQNWQCIKNQQDSNMNHGIIACTFGLLLPCLGPARRQSQSSWHMHTKTISALKIDRITTWTSIMVFMAIWVLHIASVLYFWIVVSLFLSILEEETVQEYFFLHEEKLMQDEGIKRLNVMNDIIQHLYRSWIKSFGVFVDFTSSTGNLTANNCIMFQIIMCQSLGKQFAVRPCSNFWLIIDCSELDFLVLYW